MGQAGRRLQPPVLELLPFIYFGSLLGGLLIGIVMGAWIGARVADLRYVPSPQSAAAPKINEIWVGAGAFVGCIVGGVIGMGLMGLMVVLGVPAHWLTPILLFSPPVLCLVLGGFAGLTFARRRAQQMGK
jgi:hypothetical protein